MRREISGQEIRPDRMVESSSNFGCESRIVSDLGALGVMAAIVASTVGIIGLGAVVEVQTGFSMMWPTLACIAIALVIASVARRVSK